MIIYKYELPVNTARWDLKLPRDAQVLDIKRQGIVICLWALVDPNMPEVERVIHMVFTGESMPDTSLPLTHLKTVHLLDRGLVLHFFEETT